MNKIILILISIILCSCEKDKKNELPPELELQEGYIIGFDQCAYLGSHVIVTNDYKDTLVAYLGYSTDSFFINRLDTIYKFPGCYRIVNSDTIYQYPDYYYYNYQFDFRFPDSVITKYKIYLNFTYLTEEEKIGIACTMDIYNAEFLKYVRNRQIKINYATKYPTKSLRLKNTSTSLSL